MKYNIYGRTQRQPLDRVFLFLNTRKHILCHLPVVCMPAAVIDSFISINSLPIITISAAADACEDDGDVVISSNVFVCMKKEEKNSILFTL